MHRILFIISCFVCLMQAKAQQTISDTIIHDGIQRNYVLYIPASYDSMQAVPLLFNLHGRGGDPVQQMNMGDFRSVADSNGFLVLHPQATKDNEGLLHWNFNSAGVTADDLGFISALIDTMNARYNVDTRRVYCTGFSSGGFMSVFLGCHLGHRFAGVGSVSGAIIDSTGCYSGMLIPYIHKKSWHQS